MSYLYSSIIFFVGLFLPVQVGLNTELARFVNSPLCAALNSFSVGVVCLLVSLIIFRIPFPTVNQLAVMPAWAWGGGFIGAAVVLGSIISGPKIGALALAGLLLAGQLIASILIDHFGLFGFPTQKMDIVRLLGILFLVSGFILIRRN